MTLQVAPTKLTNAQCTLLQFTPIDEHNIPDLKPLLTASEIVGKYLKRGDVVVYESTVFPGATEEVCAPTLENVLD